MERLGQIIMCIGFLMVAIGTCCLDSENYFKWFVIVILAGFGLVFIGGAIIKIF